MMQIFANDHPHPCCLRQTISSTTSTPAARRVSFLCDLDDDLRVVCIADVEPITPARLGGPPESCCEAEGGEVEFWSVFRVPSGQTMTPTAEQRRILEDRALELAEEWARFDRSGKPGPMMTAAAGERIPVHLPVQPPVHLPVQPPGEPPVRSPADASDEMENALHRLGEAAVRFERDVQLASLGEAALEYAHAVALYHEAVRVRAKGDKR